MAGIDGYVMLARVLKGFNQIAGTLERIEMERQKEKRSKGVGKT
jgi:hypothetical protein